MLGKPELSAQAVVLLSADMLGPGEIAQALLTWVLFIPLLTFHEFAHAWVAWKLGDDTAYKQGRVTLNPIMHMEWIGTVVLPLLAIFLSMSGPGGAAVAGFIIGWGRPVPVDLQNLSRPRLYDSMIAMAGPAMNLLLAFLIVGFIKVLRLNGVPMTEHSVITIFERMAIISLVLCFFNLLPIPPLDGSHLLWHALRLSWEAYFKAIRIGFFLVIVAIQVPQIRSGLSFVIFVTYYYMQRLWGIDF